ncbi:MAG: ribosomal RNA large subunit methyltransferase I [Chitinophagales bacterium]|nr:MAG: ribosomal RNA large subunit methyltransferase I [Chitinophagales bacterium]
MSLAKRPAVFLKPGRQISLQRKHPWVFSGAIARMEGQPSAGDTVEIYDSQGQWMARGAYSPHSQIRIRIWTFVSGEDIDEGFFQQRIKRSLSLRQDILPDSSSYRLCYGESDNLPGIIIDRYEHFLVVQLLSAGAERWRNAIIHALCNVFPALSIYERSDSEVRTKEGLSPRKGVIAGEEPPSLVEVRESACRFWVDIRNGHKTGFYLDQRNNRERLQACAAGKEVLNCFSYTGAFAVAALKGGAVHVINADTSEEVLKLATQNLHLNGFAETQFENVAEDVFSLLRKYRNQNRFFDLIILDPPKFADARRHLEKAARGYKDINRLAFHLLKPGGLLCTFSCSGLLEEPLFQKIVADAALDTGKEVALLHRLGQAPDHPVALNFPESAYLKGLICRVGG